MITDRQPLGRPQLLGEFLVHAGRRRQHPGPHIRHAGQFEQALDGAVLAIGAVEHRKDHVDGGQHFAGALTQRHQLTPPSGVGGQRQLGAGRPVHPGQRAVGDGQRLGLGVGEHPGPLGGDADGDHLEALGVEVAQDAACRDAGDRVLGTAAAVDDGDTGAGSHNLERLPSGPDAAGLA